MQETFYDKFHVQKRISFGAFSAVYLVDDLEHNEMVALKVEKKENNSLLEYEFSIGKSLFGHKNIINIYDYFEDSDTRGMSMENLFDVLSNIRNRRRNQPSIPLLLNIARCSFNGIKQLHQNGILHHDIKPSNLGVRTDGKKYEIVLFDFGLCQKSDEPAEITEFRNKLEQNPRYFPLENHPENSNPSPWTETSDIISMIYTIADFWTGTLPWDGRTTSRLIFEEKKKHTLDSLLPKELQFLVSDIEKGIDAIIDDCDRLIATYERNMDEEIHYLLDPQDPGYKKKAAELVFEKDLKKKFKNQHSA